MGDLVMQIAGSTSSYPRRQESIFAFDHMDEINAVAARHSLPVIEDAAQSFGATYRQRASCNLSTIGCTSFFPSKPLGCYGDGGALFTNDDALAQAMREIRVHGQPERYVHTRVGVGGRMDTLQCAVLLAKFERFDWEVTRRREIGARYNELLKAIPGIRVLELRPDRTSVYAQYTILAEDRGRVETALRARGVPTAIHYPIPLHRQPAYRQYGLEARLPVSDDLADHVISLPMAAFVRAVRDLEIALGTTRKQLSDTELEKRTAIRRSAHVKRAVRKGDVLDMDAIEFRRPGYGVAPDQIEVYLGSAFVRDLQAGEIVRHGDLAVKAN